MCAYYPESKVEIHGFEAKHYNSIMDILTFGKYSGLMRRAIELMKIEQSDKILDFGAGTGKNGCLMAKYISQDGEIVGLDISDEMISQFERRCKDFPNVKISNRRIDQPLDYDGYFDKVFISFVLHGFPQDARMQIIKNAFNSLRAGGEFFILDYGEFSLDDMPFYLKIPFKIAECKYAFDFIKRDLAKMLESEKFTVIDKYSLFGKYIVLMKARKNEL